MSYIKLLCNSIVRVTNADMCVQVFYYYVIKDT